MKKYFTTHEVAEMCQVSRGSVIRWIHEGRILSAATFGGHNRISSEDVQKLLRELRLPVPSDFSEIRPDFPSILIVDDEKTFCDMLEKYLQSVFPNARIEKAFDGFEAGMKVEKGKPDVVILDLMLPGMDGFRVCELIRGHETDRSRISIIAITGYDDQIYRKKILALGADDFLAKPFDLETLKEKLEKHTVFSPKKERRLKAS